MSLAHALSRRTKFADFSSSKKGPSLSSHSSRKHGRFIDRNKISTPVALISTTNMLSYTAPDIATLRRQASSSSEEWPCSGTSGDETEIGSSMESLTDASSVVSSPLSPFVDTMPQPSIPASADPNRRSRSPTILSIPPPPSMPLPCPRAASKSKPPAIPARNPLHTKQAHEQSSRRRTPRDPSPPPSLLSMRSSSAASHRSFQADGRQVFEAEIRELAKFAEQFCNTINDVTTERDTTTMTQQGLAKICAADYLDEIQPLISEAYDATDSAFGPAWI